METTNLRELEMKKTFVKSMIFVFASGLMLAQSANAYYINPTPVTVGGTALQNYLDSAMTPGSIDVYADQTGQALWEDSDGTGVAYSVNILANKASDTFGIYSSTTGFELDLMTGVGDAVDFRFVGDGTVLKFNGLTYEGFGAFGFYNKTAGRTRYTEDSKSGDESVALSYLMNNGLEITYKDSYGPSTFTANGNDWLLAFEMGNPIGTDYSNAVFVVEDISAVPEPTTMLLFGTGLIGLAGVARRRKSKK